MRSGTKKCNLLSTFHLKITFEVLTNAVSQEKEAKGIWAENKEKKCHNAKKI